MEYGIPPLHLSQCWCQNRLNCCGKCSCRIGMDNHSSYLASNPSIYIGLHTSGMHKCGAFQLTHGCFQVERPESRHQVHVTYCQAFAERRVHMYVPMKPNIIQVRHQHWLQEWPKHTWFLTCVRHYHTQELTQAPFQPTASELVQVQQLTELVWHFIRTTLGSMEVVYLYWAHLHPSRRVGSCHHEGIKTIITSNMHAMLSSNLIPTDSNTVATRAKKISVKNKYK